MAKKAIYESLRASWLSVREKTSSWDWSMVILVAGCILSISARVVLAAPLSWASKILEGDTLAAYEHALADAAIKKPADARSLSTIDPSVTDVRVTTFRYPSLMKGKQKSKGETWVSLPDELKKSCTDA